MQDMHRGLVDMNFFDLGRPTEEAVGQMMQNNDNIAPSFAYCRQQAWYGRVLALIGPLQNPADRKVKLGFECDDACRSYTCNPCVGCTCCT